MIMRERKTHLDNYWTGESSLEEERKLKAEASESSDSADADFFRYLKEKRSQGIDDPGFDRTIMRSIKPSHRLPGRWNILINWRVAAAILVLFAASMMLKHALHEDGQPGEPLIADTYQDPEKALEETKKALLLISAKLNKGSEYTLELGKFSETQEKLKN